MLSMRLTYTQEWAYLSDVKDVYWALQYLSRVHHVREVDSNWRYGASLEFYRRCYGGETFNVFWTTNGPFVAGKHAYVLYGPIEASYADLRHLEIVYRGLDSGVMIAVDPAVDPGFYGAPTPVGDTSAVVYDDTNERIEFTGHWVRDTQFPAASAGTVTYSNTPGDRFRFSFEGVEATLIYTKAFNRGIAQVMVDGKPAASLDMYSPDVLFQRRTILGPLKPGRHIVEVVVKGLKNEHATDQVVDVDAIEVRSGTERAGTNPGPAR